MKKNTNVFPTKHPQFPNFEHFLANFKSKYLREHVSYANFKGMKSIQIFPTFRKTSKKGLLTPKTHTKPQMEFLKKKNKIFDFSKISFVVLGVFWVPKALFLKFFEKFEKN